MHIILLIALSLSSLTWGQTMNNMTNKEKFQYIFEKLDKNSLHLIEEFYAPDVEFHDPVGMIKGSAKIKKYYENMYKNVNSIRFDFSHFVENGDDVVGVWKMTLATDKLNSGKPFVLDGTSVIKFKNGKAVYHRDYFDMGAFVYENIPVLGFLVKKIKDRFKVEE
jgi:ketosteroid isomerase-like protein